MLLTVTAIHELQTKKKALLALWEDNYALQHMKSFENFLPYNVTKSIDVFSTDKMQGMKYTTVMKHFFWAF